MTMAERDSRKVLEAFIASKGKGERFYKERIEMVFLRRFSASVMRAERDKDAMTDEDKVLLYKARYEIFKLSCEALKAIRDKNESRKNKEAVQTKRKRCFL